MGKGGWRWPDGTQVLDGPGHSPSELARAGLRAGPVTVRRALAQARDRRRLVPVPDRFAARPGSAAAVTAVKTPLGPALTRLTMCQDGTETGAATAACA